MLGPDILPTQVMGARGLEDADRDLVRRLVGEWQRHVERNDLRHTYYTMHNRLVDLGISVPPSLRNLSAACGWGKKTVDVMVEHSKLDGFTAADPDTQELLDDIWRRNHLRTKYRRAATSALEQCFALWFVSRDDDGHARVSAYPASACGCTWDYASDQLEAAMFVVDVETNEAGYQTPSWVNVATDRNLIRIVRDRAGQWTAHYEKHGLGHVPCFVMAYEPTLHRPFGTSRITREVMGYIDSAVRANVNEEIAAAFAASTQKYLLGTDGDPFEENTVWQTYIGSIVNLDMTEDGTVPQFGQLPQPSMQPLADHWRLLCGRMSAATGIHVSQFGVVHDQPASSDAIYAENEPLILKVKDWNDDAGDVLADIATACIATERGMTFAAAMDEGMGVLARFRNPAMPTLAQQTDSSVKLAAAVDGFCDTDTFWEWNGLSKEERDRIRRELRRARGEQLLMEMDEWSADGNDQQGGAVAVPRQAGRAGDEGVTADAAGAAEVAEG